jgi:hypothetical protein
VVELFVCVCACVFICLCVYVCMCLCVYVFYLCVCLCVYVYVSVCVCVCVYVVVCLCLCVCICLCVYVFVCVCVYICVFVPIVMQHAMRMRHIQLSSVACPAVTYFPTLPHKLHDFRKKVIERKMFVFIFSATFETFPIVSRNHLNTRIVLNV